MPDDHRGLLVSEFVAGAGEHVRGGEFGRLLERAQASAGALRRAGIATQPLAPLPGWLVIQRLDRVEVLHAPGGGSAPRREDSFYEQIWLAADGRLVHGRRVQRTVAAGAPTPGGIAQSESWEKLGAVISSVDDIAGCRWDGDYGPSSRRDGNAETIVHDEPCGPRENQADRIGRALESMTAWLVEGAEPPARVSAPTGLATILAMSVGMIVTLVAVLAGTLFAAFLFYGWLLNGGGW